MIWEALEGLPEFFEGEGGIKLIVDGGVEEEGEDLGVKCDVGAGEDDGEVTGEGVGVLFVGGREGSVWFC